MAAQCCGLFMIAITLALEHNNYGHGGRMQ